MTRALRNLARRLAASLIARSDKRPPDFVVWADAEQRVPYLQRWWLIPRNPLLNVYLHHITQSDDDRALHDHPWANITIMLRGQYHEVVPRDQDQSNGWDYVRGGTRIIERRAGDIAIRVRPRFRHRLVVPAGSDGAWTLFVTGPVLHRWGFYCRAGFVHWRDFVAARDKGSVGRGCA